MELIEVTEVGELRDHGEMSERSVSDILRRNPESLVWTTGDVGWWPARTLSASQSRNSAWLLRSPHLDKQLSGLASFLSLVPGHTATRQTLKSAFMNGRGLDITIDALLLDSRKTNEVGEALSFVEEGLPSLLDPAARRSLRMAVVDIAIEASSEVARAFRFALENLSEDPSDSKTSEQLIALMDAGLDVTTCRDGLRTVVIDSNPGALSAELIGRFAQFLWDTADFSTLTDLAEQLMPYEIGRWFVLQGFGQLGRDKAWLALADAVYGERDRVEKEQICARAIRIAERLEDPKLLGEWSLRHAELTHLDKGGLERIQNAANGWLFQAATVTRLLALSAIVGARKHLKKFVKWSLDQEDFQRNPEVAAIYFAHREVLSFSRKRSLKVAYTFAQSEGCFLDCFDGLAELSPKVDEWLELIGCLPSNVDHQVAEKLAVYLQAQKSGGDHVPLWSWIVSKASANDFGPSWFQSALLTQNSELATSVYTVLSRRVLSLNARRELLKVCMETDGEPLLLKRLITDLLVQDEVGQDILVELAENALSAGLMVVEYECRRQLLEKHGFNDTQTRFRLGWLEINLFKRTNKGIAHFESIVAANDLVREQLAEIHNLSFDALEPSSQRRLLERMLTLAPSKHKAKCLWALLDHADPQVDASDYRGWLETLENTTPDDVKVWRKSVHFYEVVEQRGSLAELHRRWMVHLRGEDRRKATWQLALLERESGDANSAFELALSIVDEHHVVSHHGWYEGLAQHLGEMHQLSRVFLKCEKTTARAHLINLRWACMTEGESEACEQLSHHIHDDFLLEGFTAHVGPALAGSVGAARAFGCVLAIRCEDGSAAVRWKQLSEAIRYWRIGGAENQPAWLPLPLLLKELWVLIAEMLAQAPDVDIWQTSHEVVDQFIACGCHQELEAGLIRALRFIGKASAGECQWAGPIIRLLEMEAPQELEFLNYWCEVSESSEPALKAREEFALRTGQQDLHWQTLEALLDQCDDEVRKRHYAETMLGVALAMPNERRELESRRSLSDLAPNDRELSRLYFGIASRLQATESIVQAGDRLFNGISLDTEEKVVWKTWLASRAQLENSASILIERYHEACGLDPSDLGLRLMLRDLYGRRGLPDEALSVWVDAYADLTSDFSAEQTRRFVSHLLASEGFQHIKRVITVMEDRAPESECLVDLYRSVGSLEAALVCAERLYEAGAMPLTLYESCVLSSIGAQSIEAFSRWSERALNAGVRDSDFVSWVSASIYDAEWLEVLAPHWIESLEGLGHEQRFNRVVTWVRWLAASDQEVRAGLDLANHGWLLEQTDSPLDEAAWRTWLELSLSLGILDEAQRAFDHVRPALSLDGLLALTKRLHGLRVQVGDYPAERISELESIAEEAPNDGDLIQLLAEAYAQTNNWVRLHARLSAFDEAEDSERLKWLRAIAHGVAGESQLALDRFLTLDPQVIDVDTIGLLMELGTQTTREDEVRAWLFSETEFESRPAAAAVLKLRIAGAYREGEMAHLVALCGRLQPAEIDLGLLPAFLLIGCSDAGLYVSNYLSDAHWASETEVDGLSWSPFTAWFRRQALPFDRLMREERSQPGCCLRFLNGLRVLGEADLARRLRVFYRLTFGSHLTEEGLQDLGAIDLWSSAELDDLMGVFEADLDVTWTIGVLCPQLFEGGRTPQLTSVLHRLSELDLNTELQAVLLADLLAGYERLADAPTSETYSLLPYLVRLGADASWVSDRVIWHLDAFEVAGMTDEATLNVEHAFLSLTNQALQKLLHHRLRVRPGSVEPLEPLDELLSRNQVPELPAFGAILTQFGGLEAEARVQLLTLAWSAGDAYRLILIANLKAVLTTSVDFVIERLRELPSQSAIEVSGGVLGFDGISDSQRRVCLELQFELGDPELRLAAGQSLLSLGELDIATMHQICLEILDLAPSHDMALSILERDFESLNTADMARVLALRMTVVPLSDLSSICISLAARIKKEGDDQNAQRDAWSQALKADEKSIVARHELFMLALNSGDQENAQKFGALVLDGLELGSAAHQEHLKLLDPFCVGAPRLAIKVLGGLVHYSPEDLALWLRLRDLATEIEDWSLAVHCQERVVRLGSSTPNNWLRLVQLLADEIGDSELAVQMLREGIRLHDGDQMLRSTLKDMLFSTGDLSGVRALMREALSKATFSERVRVYTDLIRFEQTHFGREAGVKIWLEATRETHAYEALGGMLTELCETDEHRVSLLAKLEIQPFDVDDEVERAALDRVILSLIAEGGERSPWLVKCALRQLERRPLDAKALAIVASGSLEPKACYEALFTLENAEGVPQPSRLWMRAFELAKAGGDWEVALRCLDSRNGVDVLDPLMALRRFDLKWRIGEIASAVAEAQPSLVRIFESGYVEHFDKAVQFLSARNAYSDLHALLKNVIDFDNGYFDLFVRSCLQLGYYGEAIEQLTRGIGPQVDGRASLIIFEELIDELPQTIRQQLALQPLFQAIFFEVRDEAELLARLLNHWSPDFGFEHWQRLLELSADVDLRRDALARLSESPQLSQRLDALELRMVEGSPNRQLRSAYANALEEAGRVGEAASILSEQVEADGFVDHSACARLIGFARSENVSWAVVEAAMSRMLMSPSGVVLADKLLPLLAERARPADEIRSLLELRDRLQMEAPIRRRLIERLVVLYGIIGEPHHDLALRIDELSRGARLSLHKQYLEAHAHRAGQAFDIVRRLETLSSEMLGQRRFAELLWSLSLKAGFTSDELVQRAERAQDAGVVVGGDQWLQLAAGLTMESVSAPKVLLALRNEEPDEGAVIEGLVLRVLRADEAITENLLRQVEPLIHRLANREALLRFAEKCLERQLRELGGLAFDRLANLTNAAEDFLTAGEVWLACGQFSRALARAQQVIGLEQLMPRALRLGVQAAYAFGDLSATAVYGLRRLELSDLKVEDDWILGGLRRLKSITERHADALRWARLMLDQDLGSITVWSCVAELSRDRSEVKSVLRSAADSKDLTTSDRLELMAQAANRFSQDEELARWVYESNPASDRALESYLMTLINRPLGQMRHELHLESYRRHGKERDLLVCVQCIREGAAPQDRTQNILCLLSDEKLFSYHEMIVTALEVNRAYKTLEWLLELMLKLDGAWQAKKEFSLGLSVLRESHLGNGRGAIDACLSGLRAQPANLALASRCEQLALKWAEFGYLTDAVGQLIHQIPESERMGLHRMMARWLIHVPESESTQLSHLRRARELGDHSTESARRVLQLVDDASDDRRWALERCIQDNSDQEERGELQIQLARWFELNEEPQSAIRLYRKVERDGVYERVALDAIASIAIQHGMYEQAVETLGRRLDLSAGDERAHALNVMVETLVRIGEIDKAIDRLWLEFRNQGRSERTLRILLSVAEAHEKWPTVEAVTLALIDAAAPDTQALKEALVGLYLGPLETPEKAKRLLVSLCEGLPHRIDLLFQLVAITVGATKRRYQWQLVTNLSSDDPRRLSILRSLGREGSPTVSRQAWLWLLQASPNDPEALAASERLGLSDGDRALFDHVGSRIRAAESVSRRQRLEWAQTAIEQAYSVDEGVEVLESLLADDEVGGEARRRLIPIYERQGNWADLVDLYGDCIARYPTSESRLAWQVRRAQVLETELGDAASALRALLSDYINDGLPSSLVLDLRRLADASDGWPVVVDTLASLGRSAKALAGVFQLAVWREYPIEDLPNAFEDYLHCANAEFELDKSIEGLIRLAPRLGIESLLRLEPYVEHVAIESVRFDLIFQLAEGYLRVRGEPSAALVWYEAALDIDPAHRGVQLGKGECLERLGEDERAYAHFASIDASGDALGTRELVLARNRVRQGAWADALIHYRRGLDAGVEETHIEDELVAVFEKTESHQLLFDYLERKRPKLDGAASIENLKRMARMALSQLNRIDEAASLWLDVAQKARDFDWTLEGINHFDGDVGSRLRHFFVMEAPLKTPKLSGQIEAYLEAEPRRESETLLKRLYASQPKSLTARRRLVEFYRQTDAHRKLVDLLQEHTDLDPIELETLASSSERLGELDVAEFARSRQLQRSPTSQLRAIHASILDRLGRTEDAVDGYIAAARDAELPSAASELFDEAVRCLGRGSGDSARGFNIALEAAQTLGFDRERVSALTRFALTRDDWLRLAEAAESAFWADHHADWLAAEIAGWLYGRLELYDRGLGFLRSVVDEERVTHEAAAALIQDLSEGHGESTDQALAWLVPNGESARQRPVVALSRARRLLQAENETSVALELVAAVMVSYPKNAAALPLAKECVRGAASLERYETALRLVLARSLSQRDWSRYAEALYESMVARSASAGEMFDLCEQMIEVVGYSTDNLERLVEWGCQASNQDTFARQLLRFDVAYRDQVEPALWCKLLVSTQGFEMRDAILDHLCAMLSPYDRFGEADLLTLYDVIERLDDRLAILKQLLYGHATDVDSQLLEVANLLSEQGAAQQAVELLEMAESTRTVPSALQSLLLDLLERSNQMVELLTRLESMGDEAPPEIIRKRLLLRAISLEDWVGTFIRLCGMLADEARAPLALDVLRELLPKAPNRLNLIQFARFLCRHESIDLTTVCELVLSSKTDSSLVDAFVLTLLEEGPQPKRLMRMWLQMRSGDSLRLVIEQLLAAEKNLRIQWDPNAFYVEMMRHHSDDDELLSLILNAWIDRVRGSEDLEEAILAQYDRRPQAFIRELLVKLEVAANADFRFEIASRLVMDHEVSLSNQQRDRLLRQLEVHQPDNRLWTQARLKLAREDDALEGRVALLERLIDAGGEEDASSLMVEAVGAYIELGSLRSAADTLSRLAKMVPKEEASKYLLQRYELLLQVADELAACDAAVQLKQLNIEAPHRDFWLSAARLAVRNQRWSNGIEFVSNETMDQERLRLIMTCGSALGDGEVEARALRLLFDSSEITVDETKVLLSFLERAGSDVEARLEVWQWLRQQGCEAEGFVVREFGRVQDGASLQRFVTMLSSDDLVAHLAESFPSLLARMEAREVLSTVSGLLDERMSRWVYDASVAHEVPSVWADLVLRSPVEDQPGLSIDSLVSGIAAVGVRYSQEDARVVMLRMLESVAKLGELCSAIWMDETIEFSESVCASFERVLNTEMRRSLVFSLNAHLSIRAVRRTLDAGAAYCAYRDGLDANADDQVTYQKLESILEEFEAWLPLGDLLERRAQAFPEASRSLLGRAAEIYQDKSPQRDGLIRVLMLHLRLAETPDRMALDRLTVELEEEGRWAELKQVLESHGSEAGDLLRVVRLERLLGNDDEQRFLSLYERIWRLGGACEDFWAPLRGFYRGAEDWRSLESLATYVAAEAEDDGIRIEANIERGLIAAKEGRDALEIWRNVLQFAPHHMTAIERIAGQLKRDQDFYGLVLLYEKHAPANSDGVRLLKEALHLTRNRDLEVTLRIRVLEELGKRLGRLAGPLVIEYAELLHQVGRSEEAVEALLYYAQDDEGWHSRRERMAAKLLVGAEGRLGESVNLLTRLWQQQPSKELVSIFEKAIRVHAEPELIEVLLDEEVLGRCSEPSLRAIAELVSGEGVASFSALQQRRVIDLLRTKFGATDSRLLVRLMALHEEGSETHHEIALDLFKVKPSAELALEVANSCDSDQLDRKALWCRKALELRPNDESIMLALLSVERGRQEWRHVLRLLDSLSLRAATTAKAVRYLEDQLSVYAEALNEPLKAEVTAQRILRESPLNEVAYEFLMSRTHADDRQSVRRELITQRLQYQEEPALRAHLAQLAESLGDDEGAARHWWRLVDDTSWSKEALGRLYELEKSPMERASLRSRVLELVEGDGERTQLLLEEAKYQLQTDRLIGAKRALLAVLDIQPEHREATILFESVLEQLGDFNSLATYLFEQERFEESAELFASLPGGEIQSVASLEKAINFGVKTESTFETLASHYRSNQEWSQLMRLLRTWADRVGDDERRASLKVQASEIEEAELGEPSRAFEEMVLAFESEPNVALARRLLGLSARLSNSKVVFDMIGEFLFEAADQDALVRICRDLHREGWYQESVQSFIWSVMIAPTSPTLIALNDAHVLSHGTATHADLIRRKAEAFEEGAEVRNTLLGFALRLDAKENLDIDTARQHLGVIVLDELDAVLKSRLLTDFERLGFVEISERVLESQWRTEGLPSAFVGLLRLAVASAGGPPKVSTLLQAAPPGVSAAHPLLFIQAFRLIGDEGLVAMREVVDLQQLSAYSEATLAEMLHLLNENGAAGDMPLVASALMGRAGPGDLSKAAFLELPIRSFGEYVTLGAVEGVDDVLLLWLAELFCSHRDTPMVGWSFFVGLLERLGQGSSFVNAGLMPWLISQGNGRWLLEAIERVKSVLTKPVLVQLSIELESHYEVFPSEVERFWRWCFEGFQQYESGHRLWRALTDDVEKRRLGDELLMHHEMESNLACEIFEWKAALEEGPAEKSRFLEAALNLNPRGNAFEQLVALQVGLGRNDRLVGLFDERLAVLPELSSDRSFYRLKGDSLVGLSDFAAAERAYRAAVDLGNGFDDRVALGDVLWHQGKFKDYVSLDIRTLMLEGDKRARFDTSFQRLIGLDNQSELFRYLSHGLLEVQPHEQGVRTLIRVMKETGRFWEGVQVLMKVSQQLGGAEKTFVLFEAGLVLAHRLGRQSQAIDCFRQCLDGSVTSEDARLELIEALGKQRRQPEMLTEAEHLTLEGRIRAGLPLVEAYREQDRQGDANIILLGLFNRDEADVSFFRPLFDGLKLDGDVVGATDVAMRHHLARGGLSAGLLREVAHLQLAERNDRAGALTWLGYLEPSEKTVEDLRFEMECHFGLGQVDRLKAWLVSTVECIQDEQLGLELAQRIVEAVRAEELAPLESIEWLEQLSVVSPRSHEILTLMLPIAEAGLHFEIVCRTLLKLLRLPIGTAQEVEVLARLGAVYALHLESPEQAIGYLERALRKDADQLASRILLARIYLNRDFSKRALGLLAEVRNAPMPTETLHLEYLSLVLDCGQRVKGGRTLWAARTLLALQPTHRLALENLANHAAGDAQWDEAERLILELLAHHRGEMLPTDLSNWLYILGSVNEFRIGFSMAKSFYEQALEVDPSNERAQRSLGGGGAQTRAEDSTSDSPSMQSLLDFDGEEQ